MNALARNGKAGRTQEAYHWASTKQLTRTELQAHIAAHPAIILVEVLPEKYYRGRHLPGALHLPHDQAGKGWLAQGQSNIALNGSAAMAPFLTFKFSWAARG